MKMKKGEGTVDDFRRRAIERIRARAEEQQRAYTEKSRENEAWQLWRS